ncbi:hypothetical protein V3471_15010 [Flavobacterium oreochromis]|uniref:DUF6876 family protein n=1 Tax=Flavobacterium oreochromis TaxID=2906078 RepID=UPI003858C219
MEKKILVTNDAFKGCNGSDLIYKNEYLSFTYSSAVREIVVDKKCFWILDFINSYQKSFFNEGFQSWTLKRVLDLNDKGEVSVRSDSFIIFCDNGNDVELCKKVIHFSDYPDDELKLWVVNNVLILPEEY